MKRIATILLTPALILLVLWAVSDLVVLPRVANWAREQVAVLGRDPEMPFEANVQELELKLFPPRAVARGVSVTPRGELAAVMGPITVRAVSARLALFDAVLGRFQFGAVVEGLSGSIELDPLTESKSDPKPLPIEDIFAWGAKIPLKGVAVRDSSFAVHSKKLDLQVDAEIGHVLATNLPSKLQLDAEIPRVAVRRGGLLEVDVLLAAELTPKELKLSALRARVGDIVVRADGVAADPRNLPVKPNLDLRAATDISLDRIAEVVRAFKPDLKLPRLSGTLNAETRIRLEGTSDFDSALKLRTSAVHVGQLDVGDAQVEGRLTPKALTLNKLQLKHPAGDVDLDKTRLQFREPYAFTAQADVKSLDLQALFRALNLNEIPVEIGLKGTLPCEGELKPFRVHCDGHVFGDRLLVRGENRPSAKTIVALRDLETKGEVTVDLDHVEFKTDLRVGGSRGETEGRVDFAEGFHIKYRTPSLAFKDVEDLAGLRFEGTASAEGFVKGDSDAATFDIGLKAKNFVFEDYTLGDVDAMLKYRRGHLLFEDLQLALGRTRAAGSMDLDLSASRAAGEFSSEAIEIADLVEVFAKIWRFPLDAQAAGRARVEFDGPLDFWKLNTRLEAEFRNGQLQGDSFDSLALNVRGQDGDLRLEKAEMRKGSALLKATGGIGSDRVADVEAELTNLRLEESELVNRVRSGLSGQVNSTVKIAGPLADPEIRVRGAISDLMVDEREIPSSFFDARFARTHLEGETNLFGNRIQADVRIPYAPGSPMRIRVKTTDWPFTSLLSLVGASALQSEYESNLTADVDLQSETGRFDKLHGNVFVRSIGVQRGATSLRNPNPVEIEIDDGRISMRNAVLEGPGNSMIRLRGEDFTLDRLGVGVRADVDLRLLHLLAPFLEDMGGRLKMEAAISGSLWKPEILGNASLDGAFVKLKGFPHPAEKVRAEVVFSQNRILVQELHGVLAGGSIEGGGSVLINGVRDIPVNLRLKATGLNLNVPDKVRSSGDADLVFSGRWFPFVLSGTYNVSSAIFEKELGDEGAIGGPRANSYLPKVLRQAQFDPVVLDLQVNLSKNVLVKNSLMDGAVSGQLQVKGPPQNPGLVGKIVTERGSKVIIRDKIFDVLAGTFTFNNPDEINPDIYLSAQTRVNEYDISILVQGPAKPSPVIRMSSVPPLSEQDIISLLALGVVSSQFEGQVGSDQQARQVGFEALGMGLSRIGATKVVERTLGVNVSITSAIDPTNNTTVPKLTFTRKLTDRLNASYSSSSIVQEFKLRYQINSNVSAIGSYEGRDRQSSTTTTTNDEIDRQESILGLDLEFKREFK